MSLYQILVNRPPAADRTARATAVSGAVCSLRTPCHPCPMTEFLAGIPEMPEALVGDGPIKCP
jgi:hypothetical protein